MATQIDVLLTFAEAEAGQSEALSRASGQAGPSGEQGAGPRSGHGFRSLLTEEEEEEEALVGHRLAAGCPQDPH